MGQLSSKHNSMFTTPITFDGGLNVHESGQGIADNELQAVRNVYYANQTKFLMTRPGIKTEGLPPLPAPIDRLHYYHKNETTSWLICAAGGKLYKLNPAGPAWEEITTLATSAIAPSMINFNGKLIIADFGTALRSWDGTTLTTLAGSPQYATAVAEIGTRVCANSWAGGEWDSVWLSGVEDETKWTMQDGGLRFRAGYGDGQKVVGLGVLGQDLVIFKDGSKKQVYRLNTNGLPSAWYIQLVTSNNTATGQAAVENVGNDVIFGDSSGVKSIQTVKEYGDMKSNALGLRINPEINGKGIKEIRFSPSLGVVFVIVAGTPDVYIYHPHTMNFTTFNFGGMIVNSIADTGSKVYVGGSDGKLYSLGYNDYDEMVEATKTEIVTRVITKSFTFQNEALLTKSRLYYEAESVSRGRVSVIGRDNVEEVNLLTWDESGALLLYDANEELYGAEQSLGMDAAGYIDTLQRFRDQAIAFLIETSKGKITLKSLIAQMSNVQG